MRRTLAATVFVILIATLCGSSLLSAQQTPTAASVLKIKWNNPLSRTIEGVQHGTFHSECMDTTVGYNIYLPTTYHQEAERKFPVVYFLHGSAGNESRSVQLATYLHSAITSGDVPPMLMVFANGGHNSSYIDSIDRTVLPETMIIKELIPHIDASFRTLASREGRAIQGFSMGGGGALRFAAKYPQQFSSVVVYGAGGVREMEEMPTVEEIAKVDRAEQKMRIRKIILGEDLDYWRKSNAWYLLHDHRDQIAGKLPIRLVIGTEDFSLDGAKSVRDRLEELKIAFEFELVQDVDHNINKLYERCGVDGLKFHAKHFHTTDSQP
jgi:S-formylglutathione hydrolase FrmB